MHEFTLERGRPAEASAERAVFPFDQWMLQRPWDCYQQLDAGDRRAVDELLGPVDLQALLQHPLKHRLARRDFKLVVADPASDPEPSAPSPVGAREYLSTCGIMRQSIGARLLSIGWILQPVIVSAERAAVRARSRVGSITSP